MSRTGKRRLAVGEVGPVWRAFSPPRIALRPLAHGVVLVCASLALISPVAAQSPSPTVSVPVQVQTRVEPKSVTIGTPFRYTMRVEATGDVELVVPVLADHIGDFLITDFGDVPHKNEKGRIVVERWYELVTYQTGDLLVPGPTVQYRVPGSDLQSVEAPDALVTVESLLDSKEAGKTDDVRDVKGPAAVPTDYRPWIWLGLAVLGLAALVVGAYFLLNRRQHAVLGAPARPPHEIALEALARLRRAGLLEKGRQEEYYVRLSSIVRSYIEARFRLRAPEMTTEEFLQAAQRDPELAPAQRSQLGQFLSEADLVKFARYVPAVEDAERASDAARQFVESTAPRPEVRDAAA